MPKLYEKSPNNIPKIASQLSLSLQFPKYSIITYEKPNSSRQEMFCEKNLKNFETVQKNSSSWYD